MTTVKLKGVVRLAGVEHEVHHAPDYDNIGLTRCAIFFETEVTTIHDPRKINPVGTIVTGPVTCVECIARSAP